MEGINDLNKKNQVSKHCSHLKSLSITTSHIQDNNIGRVYIPMAISDIALQAQDNLWFINSKLRSSLDKLKYISQSAMQSMNGYQNILSAYSEKSKEILNEFTIK